MYVDGQYSKLIGFFFNFIYSWILTYVLFLWKFCYLVYYFSGLLVAILSKKKCGIYKPMLRIRIYIDVIFKICCIFCFIYDNVLRDNTEFTFLSMMWVILNVIKFSFNVQQKKLLMNLYTAKMMKSIYHNQNTN